MEKIITGLDSRLDKKMFLEKNEAAFMIPKKFEYMPVRRDETELVQKAVVEELKSRKLKLAERWTLKHQEGLLSKPTTKDLWETEQKSERAKAQHAAATRDGGSVRRGSAMGRVRGPRADHGGASAPRG